MAGIRKQAIISSILVYIGVLFGFCSTYFFVLSHQGSFTPEQYGLTRLFTDVGQNFFVLSTLGIIPVIYKFYPFYKDNLPDKQNDLVTKAFITAFAGFILVTIASIIFKPLVVRKFSNRSALFVDYYFWIIPFALGLLMFSLLESYSWALQKTILSNFLRETGLRIYTFLLVLLYYFQVVDFERFMMLFSLSYFTVSIWLFLYLLRKGHLHFTFKTSIVTKKFRKKMLSMQTLIYGGIVIGTIGLTIDGLIIASLKGLVETGVYTLALYIANLIQIPQRSIQSIATGVLARLWKDKNIPEIVRVYQRSSINMLLISLFIFGNIWLNLSDGLTVLNIQNEYAAGIPLVFIFGIIRIIDAGTGVNGQIIATSNFWRFEFFSGVIMLALRIPLSYIFIKNYGIIGTAYSDLISLTVYNFIRYQFLYSRFRMQPFSLKTIYSILLAVAALAIAWVICQEQTGWTAIILRSLIFSIVFGGSAFLLKLTPDSLQLYDIIKTRVKTSLRK